MILISILSRFRSGGNGNSNARVLNTILKKNTVIEEVNLSFTGLDDDGIEEVRIRFTVFHYNGCSERSSGCDCMDYW